MAKSLMERRTEFVYESARLAAIAAEAPIIPEPWENREQAFKDQMIEAVAKQCGEHRCYSPKQLHDEWVEAYWKLGWRYGDRRDRVAKTHPDMVPYEELGQLERDKDAVYLALTEIARQWIYDQEE